MDIVFHENGKSNWTKYTNRKCKRFIWHLNYSELAMKCSSSSGVRLAYSKLSIQILSIHTLRVHVPPFLHGCVAHGCSTISQRSPDRPSGHVHRYESGAVFSQVPPCKHGSCVPQKFKSVEPKNKKQNTKIYSYQFYMIKIDLKM